MAVPRKADKIITNYLPVSRKFFNHALWTKAREFSQAEAWLSLLEKARYQENKKTEIINGRKVIYGRGELCVSIRFLADAWKWSKKKVEIFIKFLENDGMITRRMDSQLTIFSIINYDQYNGSEKGTGKLNTGKDSSGFGGQVGEMVGDRKGDTKGEALGDRKGEMDNLIEPSTRNGLQDFDLVKGDSLGEILGDGLGDSLGEVLGDKNKKNVLKNVNTGSEPNFRKNCLLRYVKRKLSDLKEMHVDFKTVSPEQWRLYQEFVHTCNENEDYHLLLNHEKFPKIIQFQTLLDSGFKKENWKPVLDAMLASGLTDKQVLHLRLKQFLGYHSRDVKNGKVSQQAGELSDAAKKIKELRGQNNGKANYSIN